jgi:hypothetical protein
MTDLRKAAQAVVAALEKAPYLRHEAIDALRAALAQPEQQAEPTRFDLDMDGSMEPSENGRWVRYDDI